MIIKMNLKGNFKLVPEGEQVLEITGAELKPSGKPTAMIVTFAHGDGGKIQNRYNFDNDQSLFAMSVLCSVALGLEDGDEFDTVTDIKKLIGKKVLCEVKHSEGKTPKQDGTLPVFANVKKVISLVNDDTGEVIDSPRNAIAGKEDFDDLD